MRIVPFVLGSMVAAATSYAAITERVSVDSAGVEANGDSTSVRLTADGRYAVFLSTASNLVAGDTNDVCDNDGDSVFTDNCADVFVRDRVMHTTERVSVDSGGNQATDASDNIGVTPDGRYVIFESKASNLVPGDVNGNTDCFVRDRLSGMTERVNLKPGGIQATSGRSCRISADGRFIAFLSGDSSIDPPPGGDSSTDDDVFIRDRLNDTTERISLGVDDDPDQSGPIEASEASFYLSMSRDARYVFFASRAVNLTRPLFNPDGHLYFYVFDRQTSNLKSLAPLDAQYFGSVAPDGLVVQLRTGFISPTNKEALFARPIQGGGLERLDVSSTGAAANDASLNGIFSTNSRFYGFVSRASNLVAGDTNDVCDNDNDTVFTDNCPDVFVRDRETGTTVRVSVSSTDAQGNGPSSIGPSLSEDGSVVAFPSDATNLVDDDTNGKRDIIVRASVCGDDVRDIGEDCDDGNVVGGDGCSATCRLDCAPAPLSGCRQPTVSGKASIALGDRTPDDKDSLTWKWAFGPVNPRADFGDPVHTDGYRLCIYDGAGVVLKAGIPPGAAWKASSTSFKYQRKFVSPGRITAVGLKEGLVPGKAKITLKGKGGALGMPSTALLASPVTVQLSRTGGAECWEATYSAPFRTQTTAQFKDTSD